MVGSPPVDLPSTMNGRWMPADGQKPPGTEISLTVGLGPFAAAYPIPAVIGRDT